MYGVCRCVSERGCTRLWAELFGWNEFLEFLPENRVPTSADFNTHPIQIFWCLNEEFLERENFKLEYQFFFHFLNFLPLFNFLNQKSKRLGSQNFFYFSLSYHIYLPILCAKNKWTCRCRVKKYLISHRLLTFLQSRALHTFLLYDFSIFSSLWMNTQYSWNIDNWGIFFSISTLVTYRYFLCSAPSSRAVLPTWIYK